MSDKGRDAAAPPPEAKHPPAISIEDVITFKLNRLVSIGERAGQQWSVRLFDLSLNEWRMLAVVVSRERMRAGDLADVLLMDKSQTSRLIKALLEKGLIRQTQDKADRRAVAVWPSARGKALYQQMFAEVLRSNERVLAPLSKEEVAVFHEMLEKLIAHSVELLDKRTGRASLR